MYFSERILPNGYSNLSHKTYCESKELFFVTTFYSKLSYDSNIYPKRNTLTSKFTPSLSTSHWLHWRYLNAFWETWISLLEMLW